MTEVRTSPRDAAVPRRIPGTRPAMAPENRKPGGRPSRWLRPKTPPGKAPHRLQPTIRRPETLRSAEALLHATVMISLYDAGGRPLYRNPAARADIGSVDAPLASRFVDERASRS